MPKRTHAKVIPYPFDILLQMITKNYKFLQTLTGIVLAIAIIMPTYLTNYYII
jgi:general stress protein CsbA